MTKHMHSSKATRSEQSTDKTLHQEQMCNDPSPGLEIDRMGGLAITSGHFLTPGDRIRYYYSFLIESLILSDLVDW